MITPEILQSKSLFILLHKIDTELAEIARMQRCPYCGGPLHYAPYLRKPRGGPPDLDETFSTCLSLCCGREGCRRRLLPPSVLFWGRRVYWSSVLLVVTALRQGRDRGYTVEKLKELFGVTRPTLTRWMQYFRRIFPQSQAWKRLSGRLMPPVADGDLPCGLLERFIEAFGDTQRGLTACLKSLAVGF
jgi:hypothetical protein